MGTWGCICMYINMHATEIGEGQRTTCRIELWLSVLVTSAFTYWTTFPAPVSYCREAMQYRILVVELLTRFPDYLTSVCQKKFFTFIYGMCTWRSEDNFWNEAFSLLPPYLSRRSNSCHAMLQVPSSLSRHTSLIWSDLLSVLVSSYLKWKCKLCYVDAENMVNQYKLFVVILNTQLILLRVRLTKSLLSKYCLEELNELFFLGEDRLGPL